MIEIQVLGAGCPKCIKLAEVAETAAGAHFVTDGQLVRPMRG